MQKEKLFVKSLDIFLAFLYNIFNEAVREAVIGAYISLQIYLHTNGVYYGFSEKVLARLL